MLIPKTPYQCGYLAGLNMATRSQNVDPLDRAEYDHGYDDGRDSRIQARLEEEEAIYEMHRQRHERALV